jgi:hypothetical protein
MIPVMVVPVLARHDLLDRMIKSINYAVKDLVIIDNAGDSKYEPVWNQWVGNVHLWRFPHNLGVSTSWNLGIKAFPYADYWLICNFDTEWSGDSLRLFAETATSDIVGLFDEALHPAYFEDNDYQRRCTASNIKVNHSFIPIAHDNSSTLHAGYTARNAETFPNNAEYYHDKEQRGDLSEGRWSIRRRRRNAWDS